MALSPTELERHKRHILLKEIGGPGVQALRKAHVAIVGAGALGGPAAMYLAAAGVGQISLYDDDTVDRSNLQRQVQFDEADIGSAKVDMLAERLSAMNADCVVSRHKLRIGPGSTLDGDVILDATDNFETRFTLNAIAHATGRPLVSGAASRWAGQVSIFASGCRRGAPCYRCWVPEMPPEAEACEDVGVAGPVTGLVATRMALETLKWITRAGAPLVGAVWLVEGLSGDTRTVRLRPDKGCTTCARPA